MGEPRGQSRWRRSGGSSGRIVGRGVIPSDEAIVFDTRPSLWMILLRAVGPVLVILGVFFVLTRLGSLLQPWVGPSASLGWLAEPAALVLGIGVPGFWVVVWQVFSFVSRRYVLTESRAILIFGVLDQHVSELPLSRVQNVSVSRPLALRVFGLGHVGIASAGTDGFEVVWRYVRRPEQLMAKVREHAGRAGPGV